MANESEDDEENLVLCMEWLSIEQHVAGSMRWECNECKRAIAVSPAARRLRRETGRKTTFICRECAKRLEPGDLDLTAHAVPGAREEMRRYFGSDSDLRQAGFDGTQSIREVLDMVERIRPT